MNRREFLTKTSLLAGAYSRLPLSSFARPKPHSDSNEIGKHSSRIHFETTDAQYQKTYSKALGILARNTVRVGKYDHPVLIEGSSYKGIWLECGPQEGLVYSFIRPDVARNNHLVFFALQKDDGQIPCWSRTTAVGFAQIQMVVPIAATAWELAQETGDNELLEKAYVGSSKWDAWLRRYRDTRHTGLCEGFCTWDTGHDNSPRWAGIPNFCPERDARNCPPVPSLPRLSPDLSATVYGGRIALAAMARALGKNSEAERWHDGAEALRKAILGKLYSAEDAAFYDLDAQNKFVRVRGDVISRVLGEHVVDQKMFNTIYEREIHNPKAFWAPYPLTSIAMDDPTFVRPITRNSWGGASQALTALRAPRWMEHYGKPADLAHLMQQWVKAIQVEGKYLQQVDPLDGKFTPDTGDYSPAALVFMDFTWRLAGIQKTGDRLEWNVRPPAKEVTACYRLRVSPTRTVELKYSSGRAELFSNGKLICRTENTVRLISDHTGKFKAAAGIAAEKTNVTLGHISIHKKNFTIQTNEILKLT